MRGTSLPLPCVQAPAHDLRHRHRHGEAPSTGPTTSKTPARSSPRPSRSTGCLSYDLMSSITEPNCFAFVERWESREALGRAFRDTSPRRTGASISAPFVEKRDARDRASPDKRRDACDPRAASPARHGRRARQSTGPRPPADTVVLDFDDRHRRRIAMTGRAGPRLPAGPARGRDAARRRRPSELEDGRLVEVVGRARGAGRGARAARRPTSCGWPGTSATGTFRRRSLKARAIRIRQRPCDRGDADAASKARRHAPSRRRSIRKAEPMPRHLTARTATASTAMRPTTTTDHGHDARSTWSRSRDA